MIGGEIAGLGMGLLSPTVGGLIVCGMGGLGGYYETGCAPAILGAYVGVLSVFPLAYLGCELDSEVDSDGCWAGAVFGALTGYLLGTTVGATIGWHLGKERRKPSYQAFATPGAQPPPNEWSELRRRFSAAAPQGTQVAIPLFALSF